MFKKLIPEFSIFFACLICFIITQKILFPIQSKFLGTEHILAGALIFLPHGVRVISTVVYGLRSLIPLLIAHFLMLLLYANISEFSMIIALTFVSSLCVWLTIFIMFRRRNGLNLNQINLKNIILITILSSIINSIGHDLTKYIFLVDTHSSLINKELFYYMLGDFLGTIMLFFAYSKWKKNIK